MDSSQDHQNRSWYFDRDQQIQTLDNNEQTTTRDSAEHPRIEIEEISPERVIPDLTLPVIIFHDETDRDVALHQAEGYAAGYPNSQLVVTNGLGHRRILRDPDIVDQLVKFVAQD